MSSCSPTSLTLPLEGTSAPFCNSPITVSEVTDLPEPLSPTRHSVSPSLTLSERPSMMRLPPGFLPRPTTRLSMSRTMLVISSFSAVIARSAATKQSILSLRGEMDCFASLAMTRPTSLAALPLLHAGIERVARGVADQIDAEDRDRQQQARPENQRRLDLKIGASLGHDVAPGRRLRADTGAEEGQDRLGEDGGGADIGALHDQRRHRVRHQMPPHDFWQAGADRDCGLDIGLFARRQHH